MSEEGASLEVEDILSMSDERMLNRKVLISEPELITEGYEMISVIISFVLSSTHHDECNWVVFR